MTPPPDPSPAARAQGHRIRVIRTALGLTQAAFGIRLGYDKASVSRYESGHTPLPPELRHIIERLARQARAKIGEEAFATRLAAVPDPKKRREYGQAKPLPAKHLGHWVNERLNTLDSRGITAAELAKSLNISASQLSRYRGGKCKVPEAVIRWLLEATDPTLTGPLLDAAVQDVKNTYEGHGRPAREGEPSGLIPRGKRLSQSQEDRARGYRIRVIREALGLNQKDFAKRIGCGLGVLGRYESGRLEPPKEISDKIESLVPRAIERLGGQETFDALLALVPPQRSRIPSEPRVLSEPDDPAEVTRQHPHGYAAPRQSNAPGGAKKGKPNRGK